MTTAIKASPGLERQDLELVLGALSDFARERLPDDKLLQLDADEEFPLEIVRDMCGEELGIQLLFIPDEFGGMGGGAFDVYRICEAMGRIDLGVATGVLATFLGSDPIHFGGTRAQQQRWLGQIAEEGSLMAYCATEPEAGSDLGALKTTATRVLDDAGAVIGYRLDGAKQWISNGGHADLYSVLALAPDGPSWFVVDRGTTGVSSGRPEQKHGIRASNTTAVIFEDVQVDADRLIGDLEGQGLVQAQMVFGYTRLMVAAFGLGAGWAALSRAIAYSTERTQAGSLLADKQGYTHKLIVPHAARLEASRAFIEETAQRIDAGEGNLITEGAIAKYLASEFGLAAADASIQALGGYGYVREYMVEKIRRDVRITTIYEGTSEIMEMTIARDRWQLHLKTRGQHYHQVADGLNQLHSSHPEVGADIAALACHALAAVMERARVGRLTRDQHVLMRLGEWIAWAEGAASFARRAADAKAGRLSDKAVTAFEAEGLATLSRVFARDAAGKVAHDGLRLVAGAADADDHELTAFEQSLGLAAVHRAMRGAVADLDRARTVVYGSIK